MCRDASVQVLAFSQIIRGVLLDTPQETNPKNVDCLSFFPGVLLDFPFKISEIKNYS